MWDRLQKTPREQWFPWASLASIVSLTIGGIMVGSLRDPSMDAGTWGWVLAALLVVGIVHPLVARFIVLPSILAEGEARRERAIIFGYSSVNATAAYGLIIAVISGDGLLTVPFCFIGFVSWSVIRRYFKGTARPGS